MTDCMDANGDALRQLSAPARNKYFYGKLLDVFHFELEQNYLNRKRWLLNRLGLGVGVLCGLGVAVRDGRVVVGPGVAVDALGREIVVPAESPAVDPRQPTDACGRPFGDPIGGAGTVTLCLAYHECDAEPVPVLVGDCDTREGCAPSVVRERYRLQIVAGEPEARPGGLAPGQCGAVFPDDPPDGFDRRVAACTTFSGPCAAPDETCVVLATIALNADGTIGAADTCTYRPVVYSNAMLFEMILCLADRLDRCCAPAELKTLEIVSGDGQSAPVNKTVADPLVVRVLQNGAPLANETVKFEVVAGGGQIGADASSLGTAFTTQTLADGRASLPVWRLGPAAGENQVAARAAGAAPSAVVFHATGQAVEVELPVVRAIWPPNAAVLAGDSPDPLQQEWFKMWLETPRLEITFNHAMRNVQLETPDDWLRLWRVRNFGQNEIQVLRIGLKFDGVTGVPVLGEAGVTAVYLLDETDRKDLERSRFLVQMRAEAGNIVDTGTPPRLLDAEFDGTKLDSGQLLKLWDVAGPEMLHQEIWDALVDTGATLPQSGNGAEGGVFHSWFQDGLKVEG